MEGMLNMESKFTKEDLEYIGEYLTENYPQLFRAGRIKFSDVDFEQRERIIRVEEELKHQRELMKQGFDLMEKRFEQIDKRFEQVDKRFKMVISLMSLGFTVMTFMMAAFKFIH